jgi:dipeptidyl aminopeptidase/acylaminoacyl peptidase
MPALLRLSLLLCLSLALALPAFAGDDVPADDDDSATDDDDSAAVEEVEAGPPPLIPRSVLFGNPDHSNPQISPDGQHLSWLAPVDGVLNLWVAPVTDPTAGKAVTADAGRGIRRYGWTWAPGQLLYVQDRDGDENTHVYRLDVTTEEVLDLTPIDGVKATIVGAGRDTPGEVLVGLNDRNPRYHDVWAVDLATGERRLVMKNKGYAALVADESGAIQLAMKYGKDGGLELLRHAGKGKFKRWLTVPADDAMTTRFVGFDATSEGIYALDSRGRNFAALVYVDFESGEPELLFEDPEADVGGVVLHPTELVPLIASTTRERTRTHILDERIRPDLEYLEGVADGELFLTGCSRDLATCVVGYEMDVGGTRFHLYDRASQTATLLFSARSELDGLELARMHAVTIPARDGMELVSYYSLPTWADPDGDGRPDVALPTVLYVHGGPWGRDRWGYHPVHQWMANRGAAVLSVNFRGSTGLGKEFVNAGDREWSGKMHDDLIDAVNWAVEQGIADADKVAIAGGSYGGYATLVGLTFTPEVFVAGVDIVGPSNIVTLLQSIPAYWAAQRSVFKRRVGDIGSKAGREELLAASPLTHADKIVRPLLIAQGANDPRVKQAESDQLVEAMKANGLPVTYLLYPDEGHGFARPPNMISFFAITEAFLSPILGTRFEPVAGDLEGSSVQVLEGMDGVPGLSEAMQPAEPEAPVEPGAPAAD